ncbi:MAG TPA: carbohydrate kinase [Chitinophagaceae bacterium]|jgi:fructokinase|nr:carbohydrate kinase [Chitinophagaceae bacterium]
MSGNKTHPVVCFGEILWDILPSGAVPGGAPMNVAYHLQKLDKNPALITRIGIDDKGQQLMKIFSGHDVCTDFFQVDNKYETGKVFANPNEYNEVVYDIVKPVAWDFIAWDDSLTDLVTNAEYFVYGSLAARNKVSKDTLFKLMETAKNKVLDINLRAPHYNRRIVEQLLRKADFVKMNLAELELITGWFSNYTSIEDRLKSIGDKFRLSNMVVTMGGDGALLLMNGEITKHPGFKVPVVDTVGSGDAFLAGLLSQLLDNVGREATLEFASSLGAFIATQRGACPEYDIKEVKELIQNNMIKI